MTLTDIVYGPWAITPEMYGEIREIYRTHLRGEKIDIKGVEARLGRPLSNQHAGYDVANGVAILSLDGVIGKKMNLFTAISGGVSTDLVARDFESALNDPSVKAIVLAIDSPGGTISGTADLASLIYGARGKKPIAAFTDGLMCSAAYWIGSAADRVYISNDTTVVGSIGVVATHMDISKAEELKGVKTTEIYAGKYKRLVSEYAPLTDEARANIQERVDHLFSIFVNEVARHRGVSAETVLAKMSTEVKPCFTGKQAIDAGLVDGVATLDEVIASLSSGGVPDKKNKISAEEKMDINELRARHPEAFEAARREGFDAGKAEAEKAISAARESGALAERERIQGLFSLYKPGREKVVAGLMFDGKSTRADAATAILEAEDAKREAFVKSLNDDAAAVRTGNPDPGIGGSETVKKDEFEALVEAYQAENKCSRAAAISAVAKANPEAHARYIAAQQK